MATYDNNHLPTRLEYEDKVIFNLGEKTLNYHVSLGWLHNESSESNSAIFDELGLDPQDFCEKFYRFRAGGSWPDCNNGTCTDWKAALTRCVLGLYGVIASKGYKTPEPKPERPKVGDTVKIVDAHEDATKKFIGKTGILLEDDKSPVPFLVKVDGDSGNFRGQGGWWFGKDCVIKVTEKNRRPTVGDWVKIVREDLADYGRIGKIDQDDHDHIPYRITFKEGDGTWAREANVMLVPAPESKVKARHYAVGDRVVANMDSTNRRPMEKVLGRVGVIDRIIEGRDLDDPYSQCYGIQWSDDHHSSFGAIDILPAPFQVGDRVRVKASVGRPEYGWGSVRNGSIGTVVSIDSDEKMYVNFPEQEHWSAKTDEMEFVSEPEIKVGDYIKGTRVSGGTSEGEVRRIGDTGDYYLTNDHIIEHGTAHLCDRPAPTCPADMQPIVDAVNAGSWGCQKESVRKLVSAIVKHDLSPFYK